MIIEDRFCPFISESEEPDYTVKFDTEDSIEINNIEYDYIRDCYSVKCGELEKRVFYSEFHPDHVYAVGTYDFTNKNCKILFLKSQQQQLNSIANCFFYLAWEEILLHEKRMVLHSCCVKSKIGGILFSGPSGIGKSTQGELWLKYENADPVNGDRPILFKSDDGWSAAGSPYAGSSRWYVYDETDIRAIVMLKQSKQCSIQRLNKAEAFRQIYSMLTVCDWSSECMELVLEMAEELINDVPVYRLSCTPDKSAVDLLKQTLLSEGKMDDTEPAC